MAKFYKEKVRRDEFRKLKKAVTKFNNRIDKLTNKENRMFLPEKLDFDYEKRQIVTRKELKRRLKELENFYQEDATNIVETPGGNKITKWEYDILSNYQENAIKSLLKEKKRLETPEFGEKFAPSQMGSEEYSIIKRKLRDVQDFGKLKRFNYDFKKDKENIRAFGNPDLNKRKAIIYRKNLLNELRILAKTDDEYEIIYKIMKDIKEPETFYKKVKNSRVFYNFFEWYRNPDDYGAYVDRKDIAKNILFDFNIPHKKYLYTENNPKSKTRMLYGRKYKGKYVRKK